MIGRIIDKSASLFRSLENKKDEGPKKIVAHDRRLIKDLKSTFEHSERAFIYRSFGYAVDCIYCHASPGTIETVLLEAKKSMLRMSINPKLLNLGGGQGHVSDLFRKIGFEVYNLDIEVETEDTRNVKFDLNSPKEIPFNNGVFDIIICQEVIEHIENPWSIFRESHRLLKKGGTLIVTTPNIHSNLSVSIFQKTGHFHWFTPDTQSFHINPIPKWEIELISQSTKFKLSSIMGSGDYYFGRSEGKNTLLENNECLIFTLIK